MNLIKIDQQIKDFSERIVKTLSFYKAKQEMLTSQKRLCSWIRQQSLKIKKGKQEESKNKPGVLKQFIQNTLRWKTLEQENPIMNDLKNLSEHVKKGLIPRNFHFQSRDVPQSINKIINQLKGRKWQKYYGYVKGPFMSDYFILKKQDFHTVIQSVQVNQLKFLMIEEKVAHRYQRNLVQQIFGRVFRQKGALSLVLKIEVNYDPLQPPYNIFCYIQDMRLNNQINCRPLSDLKENFNELTIQVNNNKLNISDINMLQIFLSQILVLPLQSLVSDFIVEVHQDYAQLIKYNQQDQQQIIKQVSLKQHPSLRNPLMYFRDYLNEHTIKIQAAHKLTINKELYSCFYKCLQIVVDLILTDFQTEVDENIVYSSVCFNVQVFSALWITFHKINLLSGWMKQVIQPVKDTITIRQVISHFCPIFNEVSIYQTENFEKYKQFFLNLQMQNYLSTIVNKNSLQKYKDMHVLDNKTFLKRKLTSASDIYDHIFRPIFHEVNLIYSDPIQVAYIFNFCCKIYFLYKPKQQQIEEKWRNRTIWEKCIKTMQKDELPFIDIGFDFMAYACEVDSYALDNKSFERIKYTPQTVASKQGIIEFVKLINIKFQKNSNDILSNLLQKAFKHKKFQICQTLVNQKVKIKDFKQIINSEELQGSIKNAETKQNILKTIQQQSPQMHRLFKWQQMMLVHLKQKKQDSFEINTLQFGKCYIPKSIILNQIKNKKIVNNLSRKDCRFNSSREIALIKIDERISFYIQSSQFPLMSYFYKIFLTKIRCPEIMFNFASFYYQNKILHITQSLHNGLNFKKGLLTFTQLELMAMTDPKLVSQAIILSMILLPTQVQLRDILISPINQSNGQIFIIDWHSFYQKNFMCKYNGKAHLNTKNSLFLMQLMHKAIHPSIIKKYAEVDVMQVCQAIFKQCKKFSDKLHKMYNISKNKQEPNQQLLAMIFQSGFIFNLAQRMFKIKRAFNSNSRSYQKCISYYRLLQILHSETSYYYQQVFSTNLMLRQRQLVLSDQNWKRSFLHVNIIEFFGTFRKIQQVQNLFPDHYYKFCFQGPTQSLADITVNLKKLKAFSQQMPQSFANYSNQQFQYVMKNIDLSNYDNLSRKAFLQIIKNKSTQYLDSSQKRVLPLSFISLKSVQGLKQAYLDTFSFERVQELVIESCKLDAFDIRSAPKTFGNIKYLQLKDIRGVKYIGQGTISGYPFEIKHLKTLSVINCHNIVSIDIKCDILECLQLRNNQSLQSIYIYALNLKNISIYNNPKISLQNLGINVLVSRSSCRGDISKLYSSTYDNYVTNILKQLLICFFVKEDRYRILLTLCKMRQVSQQLFTKAGITTLWPVSSIFNRFNMQNQDHLLSQMFRIYFSNPHLKQLKIGLFLIQLSRNIKGLSIQRLFKVISSGISKIKHNKTFHSLKIQNSARILQNLQKIHVKTLIDLIKNQKFFELSFQNLNTLSQKNVQNQKQIDLIRYLSMQKDDIQKMTLKFRASCVNIEFLIKIFKDTFTLQQMKRQQQQLIKASLKTKISRLLSKRSINDQYPNHMKINRITLQDCIIQDDQQTKNIYKIIQQRRDDLFQSKDKSKQILKMYESKQFVELNQIQQKPKTQKMIQRQVIPNRFREFGSVRHLCLYKCTLQSFQILNMMPNLVLIRIACCSVKNHDTNRFLDMLVHKQIKTLDLQSYFTNSPQSQQQFHSFCDILPKIKALNLLKLNHNCFTFSNMLNLDMIINRTSIQQLELDGISLSQKNLQHKISYEDQKIQLIGQLRLRKEQKISINLRSFLKNTKSLKSLRIQLSSLSYIQQFVKSMSQNNSIIYLTLNTNYQIPSGMLNPLRNNKTLINISSNMQLPMWLINLVNTNKNAQKQKKHPNVLLSDVNDDSLLNALNNTLGSAGRNQDCYKMGLSLDGGGIRGMLLATQLEYLVHQVGYPLHKIFDCIGGTSIGGILALLSTGTHDGYNPVLQNSQLTSLFTRYSNEIFKKSQFRQLRNLFQTKYSPVSYEQLLKNYFKDCKLSHCLEETNVIVTAVNRLDNKDYVFRSMQALIDREKDFYMRDVARATSAAPTYFPSAQIKNVNATQKLSLIDGGLGMNNPSKLVIDEVKKISANSGAPQNYFLLSLGTGRLPSQNIPQSAGLKDISPIIDTYAESSNYFLQRDLSINYKGHFFRVSPSINIANKKNAQLDNTSQQIIEVYKHTGLEASKKYFNNTVIFGKYRNMNLIQWLRQNTARKYQV